MSMTIPSPPNGRHPESDAAWQLIRDDVFDAICDGAELERFLAERGVASAEPHADLMRLLLGMSLREGEARALYLRVLEHHREMTRVLGRPVHIRVAALDLLTSRPASRKSPRESRPIMVAPALLERALEEAGADAVTGLPRGGHFMNLLQHELRQRRRRVTVVFIDLDGFKLVNDVHGHARGDEVLRIVAAAGRSVLRRGDVLARIGGDEFGLMLVDASLEESQAAVVRLRSRFEELTAPLATSFSAGIAIADDASTADQLIACADRAMYEDKRVRAAGYECIRGRRSSDSG